MNTSFNNVVLNHNPVLIGVLLGVKYYEHPLFGDESPLITIDYENKTYHITDFYDMPSLQDVI